MVQTFTNEILRAFTLGNYYLALLGSFQIPEICSSLQSVEGTTSKQRYKDWSEEWFLSRYNLITSTDLYSMRCGVVHQGKFGHENMQYERVLFTLPTVQRIVLHNNVINDALNLDASIFCNDMVDASLRWWTERKHDFNVQANLSRLISIYPDGMPPYIVGVALIS